MRSSDTRVPCVPPKIYQKHMGHHWLEILDYDGHSFGLIVLMWNPGSQRWTHSDAHDTVGAGKGIDTLGYRWVSHIDPPPITRAQ